MSKSCLNCYKFKLNEYKFELTVYFIQAQDLNFTRYNYFKRSSLLYTNKKLLFNIFMGLFFHSFQSLESEK